MSPHLVLYQRDGCHLCDEARAALDSLVGPDGYQHVDIEADDALVLRYGFRVPVVALDGIDRLEAPITAPDLRALLEQSQDSPAVRRLTPPAPGSLSRSPRSAPAARRDRE